VAEETAMSKTGNGTSGAGAISKIKALAPGPERDALFERANNGDESCLPEVRALLADGDRRMALREANGSPAKWLRRHLVESAGGKNVLIKEAMRCNTTPGIGSVFSIGTPIAPARRIG
jgi:hypothetical protein